MALDALPDEDFSSYKIGSVCATAAQAFPICSADTRCADLKEEPSSLCGEPSLPLLQTLQRRARYTCAISRSARQALPPTSKSQRPSLTKRHHLFPQTGLLKAVAFSTDPGCPNSHQRAECPNSHQNVRTAWHCQMTEPQKWTRRETPSSKAFLHQPGKTCSYRAVSLNIIVKCKQYRDKIYIISVCYFSGFSEDTVTNSDFFVLYWHGDWDSSLLTWEYCQL